MTPYKMFLFCKENVMFTLQTMRARKTKKHFFIILILEKGGVQVKDFNLCNSTDFRSYFLWHRCPLCLVG